MVNKQWTDEEERFLREQNRPVLTMNKVLPNVRMLTGIERQARDSMTVIPRQGVNSDDARVMKELLDFVEEESLGIWERLRKSQDVYICGRGYIKTDISFEENDDGDVIYGRRHPLAVFRDPLSDSWHSGDWRWVADTSWVTEEEAKELWPDFEDSIKVGDWLSGDVAQLRGDQIGDRDFKWKLFLDDNTKRVRLVEYWYRKREEVWIATHLETGTKILADRRFMELYERLDPMEKSKIEFVKRPMSSIWVATIMNWLLLQNKPSPYMHNQFPIIPYIGIQYHEEPYGIVEYLKDPQKLRNKAFSQLLNHLNRSANSGWLNKEGDGSDPQLLERFGSVPGVVIPYKEVKPDRIEPAQLSSGHLTLVRDADMEMREISLINQEVLGLTTQKTISGRAIEARQRGGLVGNEDILDNQLLGDKILGMQLINLIQETYTEDRLAALIDALGGANPQGVISSLVKGATTDIGALVNRLVKGQFSYVVDRGPSSATARQATLSTLLQMGKDFPGSVPADVIVELLDVPESIRKRMLDHIKAQGLLPALIPSEAAQGGQSSAGPQLPQEGLPGGASTGGPENAILNQMAEVTGERTIPQAG